jgi:hypothetical protein
MRNEWGDKEDFFRARPERIDFLRICERGCEISGDLVEFKKFEG